MPREVLGGCRTVDQSSVEGNPALPHRQQAAHSLKHGGLPCAIRPDEGDDLPLWHRVRNRKD